MQFVKTGAGAGAGCADRIAPAIEAANSAVRAASACRSCSANIKSLSNPGALGGLENVAVWRAPRVMLKDVVYLAPLAQIAVIGIVFATPLVDV